MELTYDGKKNFVVHVLGRRLEGLNEVGELAGEVLLPNGTFLLEVTARDGTWTATPG